MYRGPELQEAIKPRHAPSSISSVGQLDVKGFDDQKQILSKMFEIASKRIFILDQYLDPQLLENNDFVAEALDFVSQTSRELQIALKSISPERREALSDLINHSNVELRLVNKKHQGLSNLIVTDDASYVFICNLEFGVLGNDKGNLNNFSRNAREIWNDASPLPILT